MQIAERPVLPQVRQLLLSAGKRVDALAQSLAWLDPARVEQSTAREVRLSQWHAGQAHMALVEAHSYAVHVTDPAVRELLVGARPGSLASMRSAAAAGADLLVGADDLAQVAERAADPADRARIFREAIGQGAAGAAQVLELRSALRELVARIS